MNSQPDINGEFDHALSPSGRINNMFEAYGIAAESVRAVCCADLNFDSNFCYTWLVLTDDSIYLIKGNRTIDRSDFTESAPIPEPESGCGVEVLKRSECENIRVESQVGAVSLSAVYDGIPRRIVLASNSCADGLREFAVRANSKADSENSDFGNARMPHSAAGRSGEKRFPKYGAPSKKGRHTGRKSADSRSTFRRLLGFFAPYKFRVIAVLLCYLGVALFGLATPYLSGTVLYGEVINGKNALGGIIPTTSIGTMWALLLVVIVMLGAKILTQVFNMLHSLIVAKFVPFVIRDIKNRIFDAMSRLSVSFYQSRETGTLMTRVLDDADEVTSLFIDNLPSLIIDMFTLVIAAVIMFSLNRMLALAALILLPVSSVVSYILIPKLWTLHGRKHRASRALNSYINDNLTGARVVRVFGSQDDEISRFDAPNSNLRDVEVDIVKTESKIIGLFSAVREIAAMAVYAIGAFFILSRTSGMNYAMLITFTGYVGMLTAPMDSISRFFRQWVNCMNSARRIFEIIDAKPDVTESDHPVHLDNIKGNVELQHVSFSYDKGYPVLKNVSFSAENGKLLGIVGRSGAGKSTLLNLITRLYDVDEGRILIDGVDIRDIAFSDLRGLIAMVSQETYIFMGTVAENIAYAKPDATREEIIAAARMASAHDFIMRLPDGYDTVIGAAGRALSGGERQRISIARAILTDPKILILDEATAAVDTETEINIQRSIDRLVKGRTTISVAHRLSTLRDADMLIVLENGEVIEHGTHRELMNKKGTYYNLAVIQSRALAREGVGAP